MNRDQFSADAVDPLQPNPYPPRYAQAWNEDGHTSSSRTTKPTPDPAGTPTPTGGAAPYFGGQGVR
ncbi:hypothetical protein SSPS47_02185 [Streptomyces sp. S4.7]|nr:hypothetical protein SSPS47_02185 [Streptomyces sp. S4.7]